MLMTDASVQDMTNNHVMLIADASGQVMTHRDVTMMTDASRQHMVVSHDNCVMTTVLITDAGHG